jgi:hypothetical protein
MHLIITRTTTSKEGVQRKRWIVAPAGMTAISVSDDGSLAYSPDAGKTWLPCENAIPYGDCEQQRELMGAISYAQQNAVEEARRLAMEASQKLEALHAPA